MACLIHSPIVQME